MPPTSPVQSIQPIINSVVFVASIVGGNKLSLLGSLSQTPHSSKYAVPPSIPRQSKGSVDSSHVNEKIKIENNKIIFL